MLVLLIILLLSIDVAHTLQCITNCSIGNFRFGEPISIPDGRCQQRKSKSDCTMSLKFLYHQHMYNADFDTILLPSDFIHISSGSYLFYTISYECSKQTDCVLTYAQNRIDEMTRRSYDANRIYGQLAPFIQNSTRQGSIQCYNTRNQIIECSASESCSLDYDQRAKKVRSRGCSSDKDPTVSMYDGKSYSSFDVSCNRNLCNDDATFEQVKTIFVNNGLTDDNGRRIAAGTKEMASIFLILLPFISIIVSYF
ncbi:unnamed protein product [Adineta steineri]|uniref:Uncharacterized protein n=1 Tax=Adineta steineri TaxID=433720 RepID=A0A814VWV7_9BILA|nr:unnamed protein product [Adineta steineri]CAF3533693.1 unnamed protein product [Adineta steineri]